MIGNGDISKSYGGKLIAVRRAAGDAGGDDNIEGTASSGRLETVDAGEGGTLLSPYRLEDETDAIADWDHSRSHTCKSATGNVRLART